MRLSILLISFFFLCSSLSAQNNVPAQKKHVSLNPYDFTIKDTANYIFFPNTQIQLKPPAHFVPYEKIHGFMHPGSSSTLQVTEIQGTPYVMYVKGLTEEYFAQQGIKLVNTENITTKNGNKAVIYTLSFTVKGIDYERMMMFTGDYDRTIWVNANYPVMTKFLLESVLKNSLLSVRF